MRACLGMVPASLAHSHWALLARSLLLPALICANWLHEYSRATTVQSQLLLACVRGAFGHFACVRCAATHNVLRFRWAHPCEIFAASGLTQVTSAPGLGSPLPQQHHNWAHRNHIGTYAWLTPATITGGLGSPLPHLHRDWAHPRHICTGTGLAPASSAPGLPAGVHQALPVP